MSEGKKMFGIGEKVACILENWPDLDVAPTSVLFPLKRNQIVVVRAVWPARTNLGSAVSNTELISIGIDNPDLIDWVQAVNATMVTHDLWPADWFRRLQKLDHSQGLSTLVGMFDTTRTPEGVGA